ncbi:hypothetical protein JOD47_001459 [Arthrobacter tumbae]|nr:hypothetical protein [Arthrobacter tumbae]
MLVIPVTAARRPLSYAEGNAHDDGGSRRRRSALL